MDARRVRRLGAFDAVHDRERAIDQEGAILADRDRVVPLLRPDFMLVGPYHFLDSLMKREADYLERGGRFIIPFPQSAPWEVYHASPHP